MSSRSPRLPGSSVRNWRDQVADLTIRVVRYLDAHRDATAAEVARDVIGGTGGTRTPERSKAQRILEQLERQSIARRDSSEKTHRWGLQEQPDDIVVDLLGLCGVTVGRAAVPDSLAERALAVMWAAAVHLDASDNHGVVIPPRPSWVPDPNAVFSQPPQPPTWVEQLRTWSEDGTSDRLVAAAKAGESVLVPRSGGSTSPGTILNFGFGGRTVELRIDVDPPLFKHIDTDLFLEANPRFGPHLLHLSERHAHRAAGAAAIAAGSTPVDPDDAVDLGVCEECGGPADGPDDAERVQCDCGTTVCSACCEAFDGESYCPRCATLLRVAQAKSAAPPGRIGTSSSLKRIAWAYGCAKRDSPEERELEALLRAKVAGP